MIERWVALWDRREAPTSLALTRIFVGTVVLFDLLAAQLAGAVPELWTPPPLGMAGGFSGELPLTAQWLGATPATALLLWRVAVVSSLLFLFGALHRPSGFVLTFALAQLGHCQPDSDGFDRLMRIAVPILALSRADARWSVDAWVRRKLGKTAPARVPAWPRYLLAFQLAWTYFSAAHNRDDPAWWPHGGFSAIGQILADPHFARFPAGSLSFLYPLTQLATAATMLFELSAPLMVLSRDLYGDKARGGRWTELTRKYRLRWAWLGLGVLLHLGIALTMQLGMFPFGMLALYPAFLHPDDHRALRKPAAPSCTLPERSPSLPEGHARNQESASL
jgi:hypothetical protein